MLVNGGFEMKENIKMILQQLDSQKITIDEAMQKLWDLIESKSAK